MSTGNSLLETLLVLGHATSQNLSYAYKIGSIGYGEETITETNLLEMKRRHPRELSIKTFGKKQESFLTGADWEWHIIGRRDTLKLRVQAKRINVYGNLTRLHQKAPSASVAQIDLLIDDAKANRLKPIYCFIARKEIELRGLVPKSLNLSMDAC